MLEGYKQHPVYSTVWVNESGDILQKKVSGEIVKYNMKALVSGYKIMKIILLNKQEYVHRLVLETFVRMSNKGEECAHLDGNKLNNLLSNLRWVSPKENSEHMLKHGTQKYGADTPTAKLTEAQVLEIRSYQENVSPTWLGKKYGVSAGVITGVLKRKTYKNI